MGGRYKDVIRSLYGMIGQGSVLSAYAQKAYLLFWVSIKFVIGFRSEKQTKFVWIEFEEYVKIFNVM